MVRGHLGNNSIERFTVGRLSVVDDLLKIYQERPHICNHEIRVTFHGERGLDAGGLTRELYPLFWNSLQSSFFDGNIEKVPMVTPRSETDYVVIGKILSHGFVLTGFFPLYISVVCASYLLSGISNVSDDTLLHSFFNFLDLNEAKALQTCLSEKRILEEEQDNIISLFARFNSTAVPTSTNLEQLTKNVAKYALLCQPYFALDKMRSGMLASHPSLWTQCNPVVASSLFIALMPSAIQVWEMVIEPEFNSSIEARVFDYFRRFIHSISMELLCKLLQYITGKPQCSINSIKVTFCLPASEFERRPTASTCASTVCLPTNYESFSSFSKEFSEILRNSHMWSFDAL